jgi:hypothetical protein
MGALQSRKRPAVDKLHTPPSNRIKLSPDLETETLLEPEAKAAEVKAAEVKATPATYHEIYSKLISTLDMLSDDPFGVNPADLYLCVFRACMHREKPDGDVTLDLYRAKIKAVRSFPSIRKQVQVARVLLVGFSYLGHHLHHDLVQIMEAELGPDFLAEHELKREAELTTSDDGLDLEDDQDGDITVRLGPQQKAFLFTHRDVLCSGLIKNVLSGDREAKQIDLVQIDDAVVDDIVTYLTQHQATEQLFAKMVDTETIMTDTLSTVVSDVTLGFLRAIDGRGRENLYHMANAASYLMIPGLFHLICVYLASLVRGRPVEVLQEEQKGIDIKIAEEVSRVSSWNDLRSRLGQTLLHKPAVDQVVTYVTGGFTFLAMGSCDQAIEQRNKSGCFVDKKVLMAHSTLQNTLVKYCPHQSGEISVPGNGMGASRALREIHRYLVAHQTKVPPIVEKPLRNKDLAQVMECQWDAKFIKNVGKDRQLLYDVILLSNYLGITSLLHLGCAQVASLIKGKPLEKIKKVLQKDSDAPADLELFRRFPLQNPENQMECRCRYH